MLFKIFIEFRIIIQLCLNIFFIVFTEFLFSNRAISPKNFDGNCINVCKHFLKVKYYGTDENILEKIKTITNKNNKNI